MRKRPKIVVAPYEDDGGAIGTYLVWVYPDERVPMGARVVFFRANQEKKLVCYVHHEAASSDVSVLNDENHLGKIAQRATQKRSGVVFSEEYDVFSDFGEW